MDGRLASLVRAIAEMQLRSWINVVMRGLSRDPLPSALGLLFSGASALAAMGFGFGAFVVTAFGGEDGSVQFWLVAGLLVSVTLISTLSGASGESGDLASARMLQVYPVPRRDLLLLDVAAQVFSPTLLFFLPATAGLPLGIAVNHLLAGRPGAAMLPVPAVAAGFVVTALLLRVLAGLVALGGRRARETVVVGLTAVLLGIVFLGPAVQDGRVNEVGRAIAGTAGFVRLTHAGAAASLAVPRSVAGALVDAAVLVAWVAAAWRLHRRVTGRVLDGDAGRFVARRGAARGWSPASRLQLGPSAGAAIADFRTLVRMPVVWIQLGMPAVFGLLLGRSDHPAGNAAQAEIAAAWAPVLASFGAQVFFTAPLFSNLFGSDHAGSAQYVLAPAPAWRILLGKTASRLAFGAAQVAVFFVALSYRVPDAPVRDFAMAFASWASGALWVAAAGAFISIRLPFRIGTGASRERQGQANRLLSSLLGQVLVASVLLPPAAMILGGRALRGESGHAAGIAASTVAGAVLWAVSAVWCSELWPRWGPRMAEELSRPG